MAISYVYTGQPMTGTAQDDFVIGYAGSTGTSNNTILGNDGDDWIVADSSDTWIPNASYLNGSIANAFNLDTIASPWTTAENPQFGDPAIPHTTALVEATIGQSEYFRVAIGAGQQITIDIDFASNTAIGTPRDLVVELQDSLGNIIATADDSLVTDGGVGSTASTAGSASSYDPYLAYTATTAGTYYINVRPFGGGPGSTFTENNTFVLNVSVTGHAVAASNPVQGNDTIDGGAGDDFIAGGGGADIIDGGIGNDLIHAGLGTDIVHAGDGDDTLYGGEGSEENIHGDRGNDVLHSGGEGHYYGDDGNDTIYAGLTSGVNEVLDGGAGVDMLDTTSWNGAYVVDLAAGTTNFGEQFTNFENVVTGNGADTVTGTTGANIIRTGGDADTIDAGGGQDLVDGGAGNDTIDGGAGADTMIGGLGDDVYLVDNANDVITELAGGGVDTVLSGIDFTLSDQLERLTLTGTANRRGTGNGLGNLMIGNSGDNTLDGKGGADEMRGGDGDDTYHVDDAGDLVVEVAGQGRDQVLASLSFTLGFGQEIEILSFADLAATTPLDLTGNAFANTLTGNAGKNRLDGGGGADILKGGLGNDTYVVEAAGDRIKEGAGGGTDTVEASIDHTLASNVENLTLTGVADLRGKGNTLANTLRGNAGGNLLDGRKGADTMKGGDGDDTYMVDDAGDLVQELAGEGTDTVKATTSFTLGNNVENLTLLGGGDFSAFGNGLANFLRGNRGDNRLDGGGGGDTMRGDDGEDTYVVDNTHDVVQESAGGGVDLVEASVSFTLGNNVEKLTLTGNAWIDARGNGLDNTILGNSGSNLVAGGLGNDMLTGGDGKDDFLFDTTPNALTNLDTIADFVVADDTILLDRDVFTTLTALGKLAAGAFRVGAAAADDSDRIIYNDNNGRLYYDSDGTGAAAQVQIARLTGAPALTSSDFQVVA